jgi:hypothetical protein
MALGATHTLKFIGGFLIGCQWYEGLKADGSLPAPELAMPKGMRIDYPRCVPMAWKGNSPNGYQVDAESQYPDGRVGSLGNLFHQAKESRPPGRERRGAMASADAFRPRVRPVVGQRPVRMHRLGIERPSAGGGRMPCITQVGRFSEGASPAIEAIS